MPTHKNNIADAKTNKPMKSPFHPSGSELIKNMHDSAWLREYFSYLKSCHKKSPNLKSFKAEGNLSLSQIAAKTGINRKKLVKIMTSSTLFYTEKKTVIRNVILRNMVIMFPIPKKKKEVKKSFFKRIIDAIHDLWRN